MTAQSIKSGGCNAQLDLSISLFVMFASLNNNVKTYFKQTRLAPSSSSECQALQKPVFLNIISLFCLC